MYSETGEYAQDEQPELSHEEIEKKSRKITRRRRTEKSDDVVKSKYHDRKYGSENKPNLNLLKFSKL